MDLIYEHLQQVDLIEETNLGEVPLEMVTVLPFSNASFI